jgi:5-methylcytosine-specific restriction protein A
MLSSPRPCPDCGVAAVRGTRFCEKHQTNNSVVVAERAADKERNKEQPWRRWYGLAVWKNLRMLCLARDPVCCICNRNAATIADHVKPHRGDWDAFTDLGNLQGACETCHNEKSAHELATLGPHGANPQIQPWAGPRPFKGI